MRRTSIYFPLRFVVECQRTGQAFFEPIAAFDHDSVAIAYAKECGRTGYRYRVTERRNNEAKCIYRSDVSAAA